MAPPILPPIPHLRSESDRVAALEAYLMQRHDLLASDIQIVRAPLRICPLGAHIDHQHGIVTGMTIDQAVLFAFAPTADQSIHVESTSFENHVDFALNNVPAYQDGDWGNYLRGAVSALQNAPGTGGPLQIGMCGVIDSGMPVGGLSSSAAVTVAYLLALQAVNGLTTSAHDNITFVSHAEQQYIGLNNGILDQTSILFSQPNHLTRIDCRDRNISRVASTITKPYELLIVYSGLTESSLKATGYNNRVAECRAAAALLAKEAGQQQENIRLRDISPETFANHQNKFPTDLHKRATHYFGEMARVEQGLQAWQEGDIETFGALVTQSGESSIHQYECGSPQLITTFDILRHTDGVYGTRFSGAGFRGNCIALIDPAKREQIAAAIHARYPQTHPEQAQQYSIHFCQSAGPAEIIA